MNAETIDHDTLSRLIHTGAIRGAHVVGQDGGWSILVRCGRFEMPLVAQRSQDIRLFRKFETLVNYLKKLGIMQFDVDAASYGTTEKNRIKRPDRSEALKKAHEAAAYDKWFREQVQESFDDPRPDVSDEDARKTFAQFRADLLRQAK